MGADQAGRILVCEDEHDLADQLAEMLELHGYEARVCHDGPSALQQAARWRPTAAIIDIGLPGTTGYALAQELQDLLGKEVLLIALTGYGAAGDIELARHAGFHWHFEKPAPHAFLIQVLRDPGRKPVARQDGVPLNPPR
jgi:two-component system CheB/CheR fusion protein